MKNQSFPAIRFFWTPFVAVAFNAVGLLICWTDDYGRQFIAADANLLLLDSLLSVFLIVICSEINLWVFRRLERRFPIATRLRTLIALHTAASALVLVTVSVTEQMLVYRHFTPMQLFMLKENILILIITALAMNALYIGMTLFERFRAVEAEAEALKRVSIEAQNAALRQQLDPHFLFNSLNALTALIEEEPDGAVEFVKELSEVYRYVLQTQDVTTVSVADEIAFAKAYSYLHEMRFGDNFRVEWNIPESMTQSLAQSHYQLPPLVVQTCIENAVKHNIVSREKPLRITVCVEKSTEGAMLVVQHRLQPKRTVADSMGIGLANMQHRYSLLTERGVRVERDACAFVVRLPLLHPESAHFASDYFVSAHPSSHLAHSPEERVDSGLQEVTSI
jgi:hypothetical protein